MHEDVLICHWFAKRCMMQPCPTTLSQSSGHPNTSCSSYNTTSPEHMLAMDDIDGVTMQNPLIPAWSSIPSSVTSAYSNITANNNSRIHNGHNFHFHRHSIVQSNEHDFEGSSSRANLKRKRSPTDAEVIPRTREAQETLDTMLKKLGKLSLSVRHRKEGVEAEKIARRIAAVFEAITTHGDARKWDKTTARQLEKLGACVRWEERFDINSIPRRRSDNTNARAIKKRIVVQIGHWNISLTTTTTTLGSPHTGGLREVEVFSTLRVEPQHRSSGSAMAIFFSEHMNDNSKSTIPPAVSAYNMVRNDSEVFQLIKHDDLDGLIRLLAFGQASVQDCDESGRSLLHVSCHAKAT
jgi:hypothetical protein